VQIVKAPGAEGVDFDDASALQRRNGRGVDGMHEPIVTVGHCGGNCARNSNDEIRSLESMTNVETRMTKQRMSVVKTNF
jgi:hypothetical protein